MSAQLCSVMPSDLVGAPRHETGPSLAPEAPREFTRAPGPCGYPAVEGAPGNGDPAEAPLPLRPQWSAQQ